MNKTNKLLYGGFAAVVLAGIVALLVSVFSPPKKIAEETVETPTPPQTEPTTTETASVEEEITPPEGYVGYWVDDDGNKVWVTQEQLDAGDAYGEELKRKEAAEKAEKEWWESRQEWIERFPFEPTHHPEIAYGDPNVDVGLVKNHGFLRNFYQSRLPYTEEFERMHDIIKEELV